MCCIAMFQESFPRPNMSHATLDEIGFQYQQLDIPAYTTQYPVSIKIPTSLTDTISPLKT